MQTLRNITTIGRISMLEISRKQVFHVMVLAAVALIFSSAALAHFDKHLQMKVLTDMCLFIVALVGTVIAVTVTVTGVPGDVEQRTVYPVVAKAVRRWEFVAGKYAGAMGAVAISMVVMGISFAFLQFFFAGHVDMVVFLSFPFLFLQMMIVGAVALWLSTFCSWPLAWFLTTVICLLGNAKFPLYTSLMAHHQNAWNTATISLIYHLLPNLESFNFKEAMVHHLAVPGAYLAQTAVYGICYTAAVLVLAAMSFARREL
jgi:ABC-type transport system involved in multi-copper enzyme maturation permease subunit